MVTSRRDSTGSLSGAPVIVPSPTGLLLGVRLSPSATSTRVHGVYGDRVKIAVSAPAEDGRANRQLVQALADWLEVPTKDVRVDSGHKSRDKVVAFTGIDEGELRRRLVRLIRGDLPSRGDKHG